VQALQPKRKSARWELNRKPLVQQTLNVPATTSMLIEWQTQRFIWTTSCEAKLLSLPNLNLKTYTLNICCKSEGKSWKLFEKNKEKLVSWIEIYNHYYQNESCQGESWTKNHSYSRCKHICYATVTVLLKWQIQRFFRTALYTADL